MAPDSPTDKQTDPIEVLHMTQSHNQFMSSGFHFILSNYNCMFLSTSPVDSHTKDLLCHRTVEIFLKYADEQKFVNCLLKLGGENKDIVCDRNSCFFLSFYF